MSYPNPGALKKCPTLQNLVLLTNIRFAMYKYYSDLRTTQ